MTLDDILKELTPEGAVNLRHAVETGKWPNGQALASGQRELCMQALIAWEARSLPEDQRSGYLPSSHCKSGSDVDTVRGPEQ